MSILIRKRAVHARLAMSLLALLAAGAVYSASALAAPELSPSPTESKRISFIGSGGAMEFGNSTQTIKCASTSMTGNFKNPREVEAEIRFTKCEAKSGTTLEHTELLKGRLGYINKTTKEVGLLLEPASGEVFAKGFWAGEYASGGLIGELTPVNTSEKAIALKYAAKGQTQIPSRFEGEAAEHYLTSGLETKVYWGTVANMTMERFSQEGKETKVAILAFVETGAATSVEPTKATLNGTVEPKGLATKYRFEYGTSTSYGSSTSEASAGEGTSPVPVSAKISGLTAGVTYHFRVVATNSLGTNYGEDMSFTTGAPTLQPAKGAGAFPVAFTPSGEKIELHANFIIVDCSGQSGTGKVASVKEGSLTIKLTGCENNLTGVQCGKEGVIETKELKSLLAYTYPTKETGFVFSPESGEVVTEFNCGSQAVAIKGAFSGVASPLKTRTGSFALAIKQTKEHVNEPAEYEKESGSKVAATLKCTDNGGTPTACGISETKAAMKLTGEEATIEE
jgi:hypothetical protein